MDQKELQEKIIENYKAEENMMILVFSQWCINHDLDPVTLHLQAYPDQAESHALKEALALTVSKDEAGEIPDQTLLNVLSLFGNDDLAFVVSGEIEKRKQNKG